MITEWRFLASQTSPHGGRDELGDWGCTANRPDVTTKATCTGFVISDQVQMTEELNSIRYYGHRLQCDILSGQQLAT